jgi:hypothetical protein
MAKARDNINSKNNHRQKEPIEKLVICKPLFDAQIIPVQLKVTNQSPSLCSVRNNIKFDLNYSDTKT